MELVGKVLAERYEIREEIGKGGMAHVYKAWCNLLNRYVAIKVLKEEFKDDAEFVKRFNVEAQAAAGISNPHVVGIYDVGCHNGLSYIVMEYVEGITLKEYIAGKGALSWKEAARFAAQICEGLAAAHKANVVHRDIKPQNIIMTLDGVLKVTDFGIARAASQVTTTMGGNAIGTVHYLSPEQARGGYTDQRTDIYSLGVVLYEMLTGRLPFTDESPVAVAIKHIQESPTPLREIKPEIPSAMEDITLRAMNKKQSVRYASAEDFLADLNHVLIDPEWNMLGGSQKVVIEDDMDSTMKIGEIDDDAIREYEKSRNKGQRSGDIRVKKVSREKVRGAEAREVREVEAKISKKEQRKKERKITFMAILAAILVVILLGSAFSAISGILSSSKNVDIPNIVGMDIEKARHKYEGEFSIVVSSEKESSEKTGVILEQSPEAGDKVQEREDMVVYVVVSAGKEAITLENYIGEDVEKAKEAAEKAGFEVKVEEVNDPTEKGKVFNQVPTAGSVISKGASVTLYVSKGMEPEPEPSASADPSEEKTENEEPSASGEPKPTAGPAATTEPSGNTSPGIGD